MSKNYDNWERLVRVVLRRQHDREIALSHSRDVSSTNSSNNSSFNSSSSRFDDHSSSHRLSLDRGERSEVPMDYSDLTLHHSVWKALLPSDKQEVVWKSSSLSFFLDQRTGKNCFLLGAAKVLSEHHNRVMETHSKSRFSEVAELNRLREYNVRGRIKMSMLSSNTFYAAYLVFEVTNITSNIQPAASMIRFFHDESDYGCIKEKPKMVTFYPDNMRSNRADGWMEAELGDFFVGEGDNQEVEVLLTLIGSGSGRMEAELGDFFDGEEDNQDVEVSLTPFGSVVPENSGFIVEGIEFRPVLKRNKRGKGIFSNFKISK